MPAITNARSKAAPAEDRTISGTRVLDAPRELVWLMFERPEHLAKWWGPKGFTNTFDEFSFRPGGDWKFVMHGPDGRNYKTHQRFLELVKPERIVMEHLSTPHFETTITLEDLGGRTSVQWVNVFDSAEVRDQTVKAVNAAEGLKQNLEKLGDYVGKADLVIDRVFDAPRDLVFKAWTDPKQLAKWWGPAGFTNPVCEADARPGGSLRIDMRDPFGTVFPMKGTFHEVVAPERLSFTAIGAEDPAGNVLLQTHNGVTFTDEKGKTRMRLEVRVIVAAPMMAGAVAGMSAGWSGSIDKLDALLTGKAPVAEFVISRTFEAPRDLVWKAWTEPERMAQWFGPKGVKIVKSNNDLRPGGVYHYGMQTPDGNVMWGKWTYINIAPPQLLVFVNSFSDENGGITRHPLAPTWPLEMVSAIGFRDENGSTTVTMRWSPINATEEERATFDKGRDGMKGGWSGTFEQLEAYLKS
ncbi:MAG TPA: SRPBCC domain-containing protein, partial [Thermoanaerobaculia bacterium]|nr:SRPBCC domain-containing protein [Thermoanaerobaculia bacterium]